MAEFVNTIDIIGDQALTNSIIDRSITEIKDNTVTTISLWAFESCRQLVVADFPAVTSLGERAFSNCSALKALVLRSERMATADTDALRVSGIVNGTGYIYVPAALVDSYKTASGWSTYANQFRALEDYTVDGTITGALDETKI